MIKFLTDLLQIAIMARLGYTVLKWLLGNNRKRSVTGKLWIMFSNRIHFHLDNALRKQKEKLYSRNNSTATGNVINFRSTK